MPLDLSIRSKLLHNVTPDSVSTWGTTSWDSPLSGISALVQALPSLKDTLSCSCLPFTWWNTYLTHKARIWRSLPSSSHATLLQAFIIVQEPYSNHDIFSSGCVYLWPSLLHQPTECEVYAFHSQITLYIAVPTWYWMSHHIWKR